MLDPETEGLSRAFATEQVNILKRLDEHFHVIIEEQIRVHKCIEGLISAVDNLAKASRASWKVEDDP